MQAFEVAIYMIVGAGIVWIFLGPWNGPPRW